MEMETKEKSQIDENHIGLGIEYPTELGAKKLYAVGCHSAEDWEYIHEVLMRDGTLEDNIPKDSIECADIKEHSDTRAVYLLNDEEAAELLNHPRVLFVHENFESYPQKYKAPPEDLKLGAIRNYRYSTEKKQYRNWYDNSQLPVSPNSSDLNRSGYQLLRCVNKENPWYTGLTTGANQILTDKIQYYGDGSNVDVIVGDEGCWFGHVEFQNNATGKGPTNYIGGNVLKSGFSTSATTGTCDLLDLVLDAPYYIDPDWFEASPGTRLTTRWDGTKVPVESVARSWWGDASQRSVGFSTIGVVGVTTAYTRASCLGSNTARPTNGTDHGTDCSANTYGRTQGWAFNSNKWFINAYGANGSDIEQYFTIMKLFHLYKPVNPVYGTKDPTISSNSWGYRDSSFRTTGYYFYRVGVNTAGSSLGINYTSSSLPGFMNYVGQYGDANRMKGEHVPNAYTAAGKEMIDAGVIFVGAAGNSNQKQVSSTHPDYDNFWVGTGSAGITGICSSTAQLPGTETFSVQSDTSKRITTSSGLGTVTSITNSLLGSLSLTSSTTPTTGSNDDGYWILSLPFNVQFIGITTNIVYPGTNTYITFGGGSINYSGLSFSNPSFRKIMISSADNSCQRLYYGTEGVSPNRTYRIRYEGTAGISGLLGSPNMVYEAVFYENSPSQIDIHIGSNIKSSTSAGAASSFTNCTHNEFGITAYNSTNRRGFPQQLGKFIGTDGNVVYPVINIGALDDAFKPSGIGSGKEWKVNYSDMGEEIDCYAPADGTLTAQAPAGTYTRADTYPGLTVTPYDGKFSGTSSACPVATGLIATKLQYNRSWTWQDVRNWLRNTVGDADTDQFYTGYESTSANSANWADVNSLEGGRPIVIWDALTGNEPQSPVKLSITGNLNFSGGITVT
jgi:hypothetical protein